MTSPLYHTVHHQLKQRIESGTYPPGTRLPSERQLSGEFDVSLITVRRAMDELVLDGLIERRQGIGSFVRDQARNVVVGMSSFTADVVSGRLRLVRTLLLDDTVTASAEVAARLGVQPGSILRHLMRLDSEGGTPLSVDEVFVPPALAVSITSEIAASPTFLFMWQDRSDLVLTRADFQIRVQLAGKADQQVLQMGSDTPLLITGELFFDSDGRPAVWVETRYRSDRTRLCGSYAIGRETASTGS